MNESIYKAVDKLIDYSRKHLALDPRNEDYVRNLIFAIFSLDGYRPTGETCTDDKPDKVIADFTHACVEAGLISEQDENALADRVMGILSLRPAEIDDRYQAMAAEHGGMTAMRWFYDYCVANHYVKRAVLDRNPRFDIGKLTITINLAKPEFRDPKKAATGNSVAGGYPQCVICHENEGFVGRQKATLRTVPLHLDGQEWFWQFSPYGYFDQHGIAVNTEHTPMHIDHRTFYRLMDFVDQFPQYFIGCNATLPRIGGSVLGHDHYQGGGEVLPMQKASATATFTLADEPDVVVEIVDWFSTVVRVVGRDRDAVARVSARISDAWESFSEPEIGIIPRDQDGIHSGVSPTCSVTDRGYEMSIIFRSNITSEEFPAGVFHAHPEFFAIKQESIGLIEAQGLFILPARLQRQLGILADAIENGHELPAEIAEFSLVDSEVRATLQGSQERSAIDAAIREELGSICERILTNTAVFKEEQRLVSFLENLGMVKL
ncbi:UDPglucose--hexose-1-phosphate uridylyltransferase [Arcanobacterium phocae]|uniref:Galactose-1-phosphate uridylyltransferase n=1 Tax=Arcanobacterium phocae TaxID=131112 RepID=A0A1H2LH67_9ACTO|nr:galactose-1-phosphate uridylyltransferase [Arcanobacterium phocae]SDU79921.1 UDPglucose--hexose-1-phosphate uridylyltransferase [Arcanobacterium phocae]